MNKLTEDVASMEREHRERSEDYKRRSEVRVRELEDVHRRRVEELKENFRKTLEAVEVKVTVEKSNVSVTNHIVLVKNRNGFGSQPGVTTKKTSWDRSAGAHR